MIFFIILLSVNSKVIIAFSFLIFSFFYLNLFS